MTVDEMYTTKQAAIFARCDEADVRLAAREGKLRVWSLPAQRALLVRKRDLIEWAATRQTPPPSAPHEDSEEERE